ncbi:MFS transporter [Leucobacter zeae]|nr:MFS transporter [Leucobacter zeae]
MTDTTRDLLRRMAPSIYGPSILFALGESAIVPMIPVVAVGMGAGLPLSGAIASALVVGRLSGNLPASRAVSLWGERAAMLIAAAMACAAILGIVFAPNLAVLGVSVFLAGFAAAAFGLARHAFMTTRVPVAFRARALSLLGGSNRLGRFAGPFLAAALLAATGDRRAPMWAFLVCLVLAALLLAFAPDPERAIPIPAAARGPGSASEPVPQGPPRPGILAVARERRAPLARVGGAAAILSGLRSVKDVLLPLWGVSIGMDAPGIALVVGLSGTLDFALFYTSGQVMDRFGRLWAALPSTVAMALSFLGLALTHDLPGAGAWFAVCAAAIGLGNGLSSGINMTLGADLAPGGDPAAFLAVWRTLVDFGGAAAPLAVSGLAALSLPLASASAGVLAVVGAAAFARWIPRYIPRAG